MKFCNQLPNLQIISEVEYNDVHYNLPNRICVTNSKFQNTLISSIQM